MSFQKCLQFILISITAITAIFGCANMTRESTVWKEEGASFAGYKNLEIHQVFNATGKSFRLNISSTLTGYLQEQIEVEYPPIRYPSKTKSEVLTVRSEILVYEPYVERSVRSTETKKVQCVVRTRLVDENEYDLRTLAEIETVIEGAKPGYYFNKDQRFFLKETANEIVKEIVKIVRSEE
jgi:hypothetical protein